MKPHALQLQDKQQILELKHQGYSKAAVAKKLNISHATVRYWWNKNAFVDQLAESTDSNPVQYRFESDQRYQQNYVYVLGLYLGDGYINLQNEKYGVYRFNLFQDAKYEQLIQEHKGALEIVFPGCKANIIRHGNGRVKQVFIYSKDVVKLFPQHGKGRKHERQIILEVWQQELIEQYPFFFLRGLIQSDGCRSTSKQGKYKYVQYTFSNKSVDIMNLFKQVCEKVGMNTTNNSGTNINTKVSKRKDVQLLDKHVGPKY